MNARERRQLEWCIRELDAHHRRLSDCNLPNLAAQASGVRSTLLDMQKQADRPVVRRQPVATF